MESHIQRWGHSLAVRIPKAMAEEIGLKDNSAVELSLRSGKLVIMPIVKPAQRLEELLRQVTENNLHAEVETGAAVGGEAW